MNSQSATLVNKLILVALGGILVCLVLLVLRMYQPAPVAANPPMAESVEPAALETTAQASELESAPVVRPAPPRPPTKAGSRMAEVRPAPAVVRSPQLADVSIEPGAQPATPEQYIAAPVQVTEILTPVPAVPLAASIFGTVMLSGTPKPEVPIDMGPSCGRLRTDRPTTRHFVVGPEGQLANVVVYVSAGIPADHQFEAPSSKPMLDQIGCLFEPYVMTVRAGQPFQIRNSDPEFHNIHAMPKVNREFNIGQPSRGQITTRKFDKPELFVRIKCDVHPWMFAYVSVMPHPFHGITSTNGTFALPRGLPPGRYMVSAAHLKAGMQAHEIDLIDGEPKFVGFVFQASSEASPRGRVARSVVSNVP